MQMTNMSIDLLANVEVSALVLFLSIDGVYSLPHVMIKKGTVISVICGNAPILDIPHNPWPQFGVNHHTSSVCKQQLQFQVRTLTNKIQSPII